MQKTSVYLTEHEVRRLEDLARRTGRPRAQLVREAIAAYDPRPGDDFTFIGAGEGPGDSVADHAKRDLLEGFGE